MQDSQSLQPNILHLWDLKVKLLVAWRIEIVEDDGNKTCMKLIKMESKLMQEREF